MELKFIEHLLFRNAVARGPITPAAIAMIGSAVSAAATVAGTVVSATKDGPKMPSMPEPKTAPAMDSAQVETARRRRAAVARQQNSVAATSLSAPGRRETLG